MDPTPHINAVIVASKAKTATIAIRSIIPVALTLKDALNVLLAGAADKSQMYVSSALHALRFAAGAYVLDRMVL
jgi:hypothetical protein